ncbi:MAG: methyl-accepting chemotaxis protein [Burkholderiaceae bacterium]|nr:methyl-accepting chemotaxis protein [Burkholderiaceae bacterium]
MKNLAISTRLWLAVLLVVVSLGAVVGFAAQRNQMTQQESALRMAALDERLTLASEWRRQTDANVVRNLALMLSNEPALQSVFQAESAAVIEQITRLNQQIAALPLSEHEKKLLAAVATERAAVLDIRKKILAVRAQADSAEEAARLLNTEFLPQRDRYVRALSDFVGAQQQAQVALRLELKARSAQTVVIASAAVVLVLVLIVLGAVFLIRSIRDPLARSVQMAEAIANGDLTQDIRTTRRDEFGQLTLALAHMNQSLGKLVQQVQQASDSIQVASSEVAAGTQDLASRTEAAASSLEQTASSMEELTATVQQSADAARQAKQLSSTAAEVAARGGQVVQQVVVTMQDINQSSQKIADIIGVIDGIAFQTNILALNAAVEAARAGESGRGFAVVASEVRNLAQRSAEAAKEIKALIGTSVEKVHSGSQLVHDAGRTMGDIVASVQRVTDVVGEISAAASEQSDGIAQVNVSVSHLDQMTQQNAALVEQSTAAAESLRGQAQRLMEVVSVFKVRETTRPGVSG